MSDRVPEAPLHCRVRRWWRRAVCSCGLTWPCPDRRLRDLAERLERAVPAWQRAPTAAYPAAGRAGRLTPGAGAPVLRRLWGMLTPGTEHVAQRPAWDCRVCGRTWPCATAKVDLAEQYRRQPTALSVYLASAMVEMIDDLADGHAPLPGDVHERFLGWVGAASPTPASGARLLPAGSLER